MATPKPKTGWHEHPSSTKPLETVTYCSRLGMPATKDHIESLSRTCVCWLTALLAGRSVLHLQFQLEEVPDTSVQT